MRFRTADRCAAFILPHLKPGMRLLDCGCGPGSITIGLAERVIPGEVIGIDLAESQIQAASVRARQAKATNVRFEVADVTRLPFEDDSFDFVFSSAMLAHVPDAGKALSEMARALKPGCRIGIRSLINSGFTVTPENPAIRRWAYLLRRAIEHNGGDPDCGLKLESLLEDAGLVELKLSTALEEALTPAEKPEFYPLLAQLVVGSKVGEAALVNGWATSEEIAEITSAWDDLAACPDGSAAVPFCEAVAQKPHPDTSIEAAK